MAQVQYRQETADLHIYFPFTFIIDQINFFVTQKTRGII